LSQAGYGPDSHKPRIFILCEKKPALESID